MARFLSLHVWHRAREVLKTVSDATRGMRAEGDLKSQMRRAAISTVSNIAEGAERASDRDFRHFLCIADASNAEVESQAIIAADIGCMDQATSGRITAQCRVVGRMIGRLMMALDASG